MPILSRHRYVLISTADRTGSRGKGLFLDQHASHGSCWSHKNEARGMMHTSGLDVCSIMNVFASLDVNAVRLDADQAI